MTITIEKARRQDAAEILALQVLAYRSEARIYDDDRIPPLLQKRDEMERDIAELTVLKATDGERIIGSVRARMDESGTCHIGRLIVDPTCQGRGIGTRLMNAIEEHFAEAARFELFTGHLSKRNLYLYRKLGYVRFREESSDGTARIVYLEKLER